MIDPPHEAKERANKNARAIRERIEKNAKRAADIAKRVAAWAKKKVKMLIEVSIVFDCRCEDRDVVVSFSSARGVPPCNTALYENSALYGSSANILSSGKNHGLEARYRSMEPAPEMDEERRQGRNFKGCVKESLLHHQSQTQTSKQTRQRPAAKNHKVSTWTYGQQMKHVCVVVLLVKTSTHRSRGSTVERCGNKGWTRLSWFFRGEDMRSYFYKLYIDF